MGQNHLVCTKLDPRILVKIPLGITSAISDLCEMGDWWLVSREVFILSIINESTKVSQSPYTLHLRSRLQGDSLIIGRPVVRPKVDLTGG